jgi:hypothetical protein
MKDPALTAIEDWTGHTAARRQRHRDLLTSALWLLALLYCLSLLTGCTTGPVITKDKVWLGGSALAKTAGYYAEYTGPLGTLKTGTTTTDETVVPGKLTNLSGLKAAATGLTEIAKP